jgi:hypothetical protein
MTSSAIAHRPGRAGPALAQSEGVERSIRRRVGIAWGLLVLNTLQYGGLIVHIPSIAGKALTQGALSVALLLALSVNRRLLIRPSFFLCLATLLALEAMVTSLQAQVLGTTFRTLRLAEFVVVLWLLTPWWGRRDLLLVRYHLTALWVILASVLAGLVVVPGRALAGGRLSGALWFIPSTQVAHYAAMVTGLTVVLWLCHRERGKRALFALIVAGGMLLLAHTRTALIAFITGLIIAGLSLIAATPRVRKLFAVAGTVALVTIATLSGYITNWLERGQDSQQLLNLTGRTEVWSQLLAAPRSKFQEIFGFGMSNGSFNGLSIDSNWLSSYQQQGFFGIAICAAMLLFLFVASYFRPRGVERAVALFLVAYCLVASVTEVGFTDASPYLLELFLAASLIVPSAAGQRSNVRAPHA